MSVLLQARAGDDLMRLRLLWTRLNDLRESTRGDGGRGDNICAPQQQPPWLAPPSRSACSDNAARAAAMLYAQTLLRRQHAAQFRHTPHALINAADGRQCFHGTLPLRCNEDDSMSVLVTSSIWTALWQGSQGFLLVLFFFVALPSALDIKMHGTAFCTVAHGGAQCVSLTSFSQIQLKSCSW
jgi:hypothetical protein